MKTLSTFVIALSLAVLSSTAGAWTFNAAPPSSTTEYYSNWRYRTEQYSPFNFWTKTCYFERDVNYRNHVYVGKYPSNNSPSNSATIIRTEYKSITVSRAFNCRNARP